MASFNKIILVGYLGRDPEIRYTPQGTAVCNLSIATTEKRKDQSGNSQDITTWFRVSVWGRQAELANTYLAKGRQVFIEGRLRQEEYTDKDGNKRQSLEVSATEIHFIGSQGDKNEAQDAATNAHPPSEQRSSGARADKSAEPPQKTAIDDDIPFAYRPFNVWKEGV